MDALGNFKATEPLQRSWAGIYLAGICVLGKRVAEARRYALEAHADAVDATLKECAAVNERLQAKITRRVKLLSQSDAAMSGRVGAAGVGGLIAAAAGMTIASPVTVPLAAGGLAVGGSAYAYRTYVRHRTRARLEELAAFVDHVADLAHGLGRWMWPDASCRSTEAACSCSTANPRGLCRSTGQPAADQYLDPIGQAPGCHDQRQVLARANRTQPRCCTEATGAAPPSRRAAVAMDEMRRSEGAERDGHGSAWGANCRVA